MSYIVLFGSIKAGYTAQGPFETEAQAQSYAESEGTVVPLIVPTRSAGVAPGFDLRQLRAAALIAERTRDANNHIGLPDKADVAERIRVRIQSLIDNPLEAYAGRHL